MPKPDLLLRIDESLAGLPDFYMDNEYDPLADDVPPVPTGVSVRAIQDGILIAVDFNIDKAHLFARFESFIVYVRPISTEVVDGSGQEVGRIANGQSSWVWHPPYSGYDAWDIALTAISNTGYESAKTAWYRCTLSTFYDNFESYGGATISALEAIYWLKIDNFDTTTWNGSVSSVVTREYSNFKEGVAGVKVAPPILGGGYAIMYSDQALDLSADGRFGNDDYVVIPVYTNNPENDSELYIYFLVDSGNYYRYGVVPPAAGWNFLKVKKSNFTVGGAPNWANIATLTVDYSNFDHANDYAIADDWRIVKADPDDATTFNDTGAVWDFSDGTWHIYQGNRTGEPAYNCSLGQIESPADDDYFATVHAVSVTNGRVSAGLDIKGSDGIAGINFRAEDVTLGSEDILTAELATAADTITLYRYAAGAKTSLASAAYTCAPNVLYWIGVDFRDPGNENRVKVYVATTEAGLWSADNLKISHATTDVWPVGSQVGAVCHACNCRFVQFRAGSPQTADYAHTAGYAMVAGALVGGLDGAYDSNGAGAGRIIIADTGAVEMQGTDLLLNLGSYTWPLGGAVLNLDFTGLSYDTQAECNAVGLKFNDSDTPFPTTLLYAIGGGTWSHSAGNGWLPAFAVDGQGPAILIPLMRPGNWELAVTLTYNPVAVGDAMQFIIGYLANSSHWGAYAMVLDSSTVASQLVATLQTNDGDDTATAQYTGAALAGIGDRTYKLRCKNNCVGIYDAKDGAWHDYSGRQDVGHAYTAAWIFLQFYKYAAVTFARTYLKGMILTYFL